MEYRHHWSLILASWITLAHFSVSATMSFSKSLGDIGIGTLPKVRKACLDLRVGESGVYFLVELINDFARCILGRADASQVLASKPGTDSATVGTSGSAPPPVSLDGHACKATESTAGRSKSERRQS
jgi:hypothetical protein